MAITLIFLFVITTAILCFLSLILSKCFRKRISFLEHYCNKLNEFVDYQNKARKSHKALEKESSDRVHELYVENEKYRLAVNKLLWIIKSEQFDHKIAYNLSDDLDNLFDYLWAKYGSKNLDKQEPKPYKSISEMIDEAILNKSNKPPDDGTDNASTNSN